MEAPERQLLFLQSGVEGKGAKEETEKGKCKKSEMSVVENDGKIIREPCWNLQAVLRSHLRLMAKDHGKALPALRIFSSTAQLL